MSHSTSPIDDREWHVLLLGARHGPLDRVELRALLDTHPERWNASVWRPGMLDWRPAGTIRALTQGAPMAEPLWVRPGAPLEEPPRASTRAPRDASGELRVLSYEEREAPGRGPGLEVAPATFTQNPEVADSAPAAPSTSSSAVSGVRAVVATSELRGGAASEASAPSAPGPAFAASGEWSLVATNELRAISASELRALALKQSSAPATVSELRAIPKEQLLLESAAPSLILSEHTRTELPSFSFLAEHASASAPARELPAPTPPALPLLRRPVAAPKSRRPLRALPLVLGGLVLLSALALILIRLR